MAHFIDRRLNGKNKSTVNRQRFLRRHKQRIKESIADAVNKRSITDVDSGEDITIPSRDISEPIFHQGKGGQREIVHPGNDQFSPGDRIERPPGGGGQGGAGEGQASPDGDGQDDVGGADGVMVQMTVVVLMLVRVQISLVKMWVMVKVGV